MERKGFLGAIVGGITAMFGIRAQAAADPNVVTRTLYHIYSITFYDDPKKTTVVGELRYYDETGTDRLASVRGSNLGDAETKMIYLVNAKVYGSDLNAGFEKWRIDADEMVRVAADHDCKRDCL